MKPHAEPAVPRWLLRLFCSAREYESITGDLIEEYHRGRGRFWYWRQVLDLVCLSVYARLLRRPLVRKPRLPVGQGLGLVLLFVGLCANFLSLAAEFLVVILAIMIGGLFVYLWLNEEGPHESAQPGQSRSMPLHQGISMHHIPVEGTVGFLFVAGTGLIFGIGIPAIREILIATVPIGIFGGALLIHWHKRHPIKLQGLGLRERK